MQMMLHCTGRSRVSEADYHLLQEDLDRICDWANKWQLRLDISKCESFLISNKRKPISFEHFINHSPLAWNLLSSIWAYCSVHGLIIVNMCQLMPAKF